MGEPGNPTGIQTRFDAGTEVADSEVDDPKQTAAGVAVGVIVGLGFTFIVTVCVCVQPEAFWAVTV
jgi:hypothetical protein